MILCRECNNKVEEEAMFCGNCGDQLKYYNHKNGSTHEYDQEMELLTVRREYTIHPPTWLPTKADPLINITDKEKEAIMKIADMWRIN